MGEYEPDDSRTVTGSAHQAPGEPPRTGPREGEARAKATDAGETNETQGKPTARDAAGNKQSGYADKEDERADEETPPLGK
jgi:hypothetical protein